VTLLSNYPEIFAHLPIKVEKFNREKKCNKVFSYLEGKANENTTQLADMGYSCADDFTIEHKPITMLTATAEHNARAAELASVERIEVITNAITDDAVSNALENLSDEELTEVMGL